MSTISLRRAAFIAGIASLAAVAQPALSKGTDPNLRPGFNTATGTVRVNNVEAAAAGASVVTIECSGACPEPTAAQAAPYLMPAFPDMVAINVPGLPGAQHFSHQLAFWNAVVFPPGTATFTICADAGNDVVETNEGDNCIRVSRRQARSDAVSPPAALRLRVSP